LIGTDIGDLERRNNPYFYKLLSILHYCTELDNFVAVVLLGEVGDRLPGWHHLEGDSLDESLNIRIEFRKNNLEAITWNAERVGVATMTFVW